jgi:hypothetical protein
MLVGGQVFAALSATLVFVAMSVLWVVPEPEGTAGSRQLIVQRDGLEIWHHQTRKRSYHWTELPACAAAELESGQWRLAFWSARRSRISYSPLLFGFTTAPPGRPVLDLLLEGDARAGPIIDRAIAERRAAAGLDERAAAFRVRAV